MVRAPAHPKIYHITHVRNLSQIAQAGMLWSNAAQIARDLDCQVVGMSQIKQRRLHEIQVGCHPGTKVGDYAPFYFCPRSIMLYILHMGNHPDLNYTEGQQPIVHLQADLNATVAWANRHGRPWAFSDRNAGTFYTEFFNDLACLNELDWTAVAATDFRSPNVKDGKQAEFLLHESFPWELIEKIGVFNDTIVDRVRAALPRVAHRPPVVVERGWYY